MGDWCHLMNFDGVHTPKIYFALLFISLELCMYLGNGSDHFLLLESRILKGPQVIIKTKYVPAICRVFFAFFGLGF
jgi:hypothetical protein